MSVTIDSTNPRIIADNIRKLDDAVKAANELPEVESTDQGKVLTVNSSGEWAALDPASQLPAVTSSDEGSLLTVNSSGAWAKGSPIIGNLDYSETEQDTGVKWINGNNVYRKVIKIENNPIGTEAVQIATGVEYVVSFYGVMRRVNIESPETNTKVFFDLTDYVSSSNHNSCTCEIARDNTLSIKPVYTVGSSFSFDLLFAIVYYTKTAPSRELNVETELEVSPELESVTEVKKSTRKKTTTN